MTWHCPHMPGLESIIHKVGCSNQRCLEKSLPSQLFGSLLDCARVIEDVEAEAAQVRLPGRWQTISACNRCTQQRRSELPEIMQKLSRLRPRSQAARKELQLPRHGIHLSKSCSCCRFVRQHATLADHDGRRHRSYQEHRNSSHRWSCKANTTAKGASHLQNMLSDSPWLAPQLALVVTNCRSCRRLLWPQCS